MEGHGVEGVARCCRETRDRGGTREFVGAAPRSEAGGVGDAACSEVRRQVACIVGDQVAGSPLGCSIFAGMT